MQHSNYRLVSLGTVLILTIPDRVDEKVDSTELDAVIDRLRQQVKQAVQRKDRLISQLDNLDFEDANYDKKAEDLEQRLNDAYQKITDVEILLSDAEKKKEKIIKEQINGEIVYKNLMVFDKIISKCSDKEKQTLYKMLIKKIDIFEEPQKNGRQIKSVVFNFPVVYGKDEVDHIGLSENPTDETVCLLSKKCPV